jgi:hypothetical protein
VFQRVLAEILTTQTENERRSEETTLIDNPAQQGSEEPNEVVLDLDHQVQYWTAKWDVTHYALREAIAKVGPNTQDVATALKARARQRHEAQRRRERSIPD